MTAASSVGPDRHDIVVIGGGIAGLTIAWEAARAGRDVVVLESSAATGGMLRRGVIAGIEVDLGAESFATRTAGVVDLVADARLPVQFVEPRPAGAHLAYREPWVFGALRRTRRAPLPRRADRPRRSRPRGNQPLRVALTIQPVSANKPSTL